MATIQKFEDLICWKKARELANFIFDITDEPVFKDVDLKRQIRRAAISPLSNIAEGFDRGTKNEFVDALFIAKGEVGEVRAQLYISFDRKYIDLRMLERGMMLTDECARLIASFVVRLKEGGERGMQFKRVVPKDRMKEFLRREIDSETFQKLYSKE